MRLLDKLLRGVQPLFMDEGSVCLHRSGQPPRRCGSAISSHHSWPASPESSSRQYQRRLAYLSADKPRRGSVEPGAQDHQVARSYHTRSPSRMQELHSPAARRPVKKKADNSLQALPPMISGHSSHMTRTSRTKAACTSGSICSHRYRAGNWSAVRRCARAG